MRTLTKKTDVYETYSEEEAGEIVEEYKTKQVSENYTVLNSKVDYKRKVDKKTGDITDEKWIVSITVGYEV